MYLVYDLLGILPDSERFDLRDQLARAVVLIPSNIAEGAGCRSSKEFKHFLTISRGSLNEVRTQLIIIDRRKFTEIPQAVYLMMDEVYRMLNGLIYSLKESSK